ncbi:fructose-bisphosphate aldolase [Rhizodiscina lignyota]|uniref:Fructose-bisphosphate aldolase n=1 Tax=Rhizodiscina lignyota TaxID=1504668 RepID=A0A9P4M0Q7_9PEZI|nr:fructose-bisphosphate aldolase [Rhizodiscina lignyota]
MPTSWLYGNRTLEILRAAEEGRYGVTAAIVYNIEHLIAFIGAAETKKAPFIILFFPWAVTFSDGLLIRCAADAARRASVPISVHLDHAQDENQIKYIADHREDLPFDSIMIDMSHYEKVENLAKTKELVQYLHERGIATEAEPGRIEGGEDGVGDTALNDLKGMETTAAEAEEFINTGVDMLAPAFGNIHGDYPPAGPQLDFDRLAEIRRVCRQRDVRLVLHGTNGFEDDLMQRCIHGGMTKLNVNQLVLEDYLGHLGTSAGKLPLTEFMEQGVDRVRRRVEWLIDVSGSAGKGSY